MGEMRCGSCGREREWGEVCCAEQAINQGRLHAFCRYGPPEDLPPEWKALWEQGAEEALADWNTRLPDGESSPNPTPAEQSRY